jgi:hypothetical protein
MAAVNQWGKRSSTDVPVAEPEAQRRRLDANDLTSNSSSGMPSVTSRALTLSPLEELPGDVVQHLFMQMDRRTQGVMAQCSKLFSSIAQQSRWDRAGSLVENGKLHRPEPNDDDVSLRRGTEKNLWGEVQLWWQLREKPKPVQTTMTDHDIGFWLGCKYPHIRLQDTVTPQLMAGLSMTSGWRSLTLKINLRQYSLSALLEPLINGLGANSETRPRELFLEIHHCFQSSSLEVPDALWNGRLELVGLSFEHYDLNQQVLLKFERAVALRYLCLESCDDKPLADLLKSMGSLFPALQIFELRSDETKMVLDQPTLSDFQRSHSQLQTFFLGLDGCQEKFPIDFSALNIKRFELLVSKFIDTDGKFSEWIKKNKNLKELDIETNKLDTNEGLDFQRFTKAIRLNQSLRKLTIEASSEGVFEYFDEHVRITKYPQQLIDLLGSIADNSHITELYLTLDFRDFIKSEHSSKWQTLVQFEALELAKPGLSLNLDGCKFGLGITEKSSVIDIPANEFVEKFGWLSAEQMPGPEESVLFQVDMPTWGNGAFRKMIGHLSVGDKDKKKLILEGLSDGSLAKESIEVLDTVPTENSKGEALSDFDEDR